MTVEKFVAAANLPKDKYMITFQSRLGREPWLQPYTDKTLEQLAKDGHKKVKVICPAFTADCLETLEEIAMQGRDSFLESWRRKLRANPLPKRVPRLHRFPSREGASLARWRLRKPKGHTARLRRA
jgi:ferrochelatase